MRLWLLRPCELLPDQYSPWSPWYDKNFGYVIRAETEARARQMAQDNAADEGGSAWIDPRYSSCVELTSDGDEAVIIIDHAAA